MARWRKLVARGAAVAALGLLSVGTLAARAGEPGLLETVRVAPGVYAFVGQMGPMGRDDLGTNATFGAIVTRAGVVLVDPGAGEAAAAAIEAALRGVTDAPVRWVIDTGSEDHRWLGNGHFRRRGARVIASARAAAHQRERADLLLTRLERLIGPAAAGTEAVFPDETFAGRRVLELGGRRIELIEVGPAYGPGDTLVWLPEERVLFTGPVGLAGRMPVVADFSDVRGWLRAFETMEALRPRVVVPGHGRPGPLARVLADTRDYLRHLRQAVRAFMDAGGAIEDVRQVDQTAFERLVGYDMLRGRNAQQMYQFLEWE